MPDRSSASARRRRRKSKGKWRKRRKKKGNNSGPTKRIITGLSVLMYFSTSVCGAEPK